MTTPASTAPPGDELFRSARWYDLSINWDARLTRELPVLIDVFGPPGSGGLIDAGCGPARQAVALAGRGYRVVGADASPDMLALAREHAARQSTTLRFEQVYYADLHAALGGGFDGVFSQANALAAAGSAQATRQAVQEFAACLRPGGRLFVQVLNFAPMRLERPCVKGPRVATVDGQEYVSFRHFCFHGETVDVTNVTMWHSATGWHQHNQTGTLYPVGLDEVRAWCGEAGLRIDHLWGDYARSPFAVDNSQDLIVVATRA